MFFQSQEVLPIKGVSRTRIINKAKCWTLGYTYLQKFTHLNIFFHLPLAKQDWISYQYKKATRCKQHPYGYDNYAMNYSMPYYNNAFHM